MTARPDPRATLGVLLILLALAAPAGAQPLGTPPVPALRRETIPSRPPSQAYVWQPGHWEWDATNARYAWHSGRHVVRRPGAKAHVRGKWTQSGGEWVWRKARWK
jgi:hypothetical protein